MADIKVNIDPGGERVIINAADQIASTTGKSFGGKLWRKIIKTALAILPYIKIKKNGRSTV